MARYTGPKSKIARKFREPIFGPDKALERRTYGPGQHGPNKRRMKQSEYSIQLAEKQKAKHIYGILERQFRIMFQKASSKTGITGELLLQFCESRLDNTVFRLGIANTRRQARQLVNHRHIIVNEKVVDIPSFQLRAGDVIEVREKSKSLAPVTSALAAKSQKFDWLDWNSDALRGTFMNTPSREQIPENIKEQLIVELYSK